jgi:hypothetical protein
MFKFLKDRFSSKKEEEPLSLAVSEIPATLEAREKEITQSLSNDTEINRRAVSTARSGLSALVQELVSLEREEVNHPKLEKIARNTLPLFEKTMLSSLARDLPEEPEAFYHAASETLKGCVKGLSGPGRYLRGVFPDEMKEIRNTVDRIGREMNAMSPYIAKARMKRDQIRAVRKDLAGYSAALSEKESLTTELSRIEAEIEEEKGELAILTGEEKEAHLAITSPDIIGLEQRTAGLKEEVLAEERAIRNDLSVISHLLRKGEKVLQKGPGGAAAKDLELVVDSLTVSGLPAKEQVVPGLVRVLPLIGSMIESGDIILKNKEEKELFSGTTDIPARLSRNYRERDLADSRLKAAEREIANNPVVIRVRRLEREKVQRENRLASLTGKRSGILERADLLDAEIPATRKRVEQALSVLEERQITLREGVQA